MKRLFRIASGLFIFSLFPVVSWLLLGLTLDKSLVNIFSLTYPIQFIWAILKSIFATGANIKQIKEKNPNAVLSSMTIGIVVSAIIFGILAVFVDNYIGYMNMDVETYRDFTLYSILSLFVQLIFGFVLEKLYFEEKEKLGNIHSFAFNTLNLVVLIGTSLITKNSTVIIATTLACISVYVIALLIWQYRRFKFEFNILSNFKYESVTICTNIMMFITYFVGFSNAFQAGEEYVVALNFESLVTDSQWDACNAISTAAKIDISYEKFNYKKSLKHAYIFTGVIISSVLVMFFSLFSVYHVNLQIGLMFLGLQLLDFCISPFYFIYETFYQLKFSATFNTIFAIVEKLLRVLLSILLPTAFCTSIGQVSAAYFQLIIYMIIRFKFFKLNKDGLLERKHVKISEKTT